MKSVKLYSSSFRAWMCKHGALFTKNAYIIELSLEGEALAKSYLDEVFDEKVQGTWSSIASVAPASAKKT